MKLWRGQPDNWTWKPSDRDLASMGFGFGACFYLLGLVEFLSPSQSSRTGRWGWLHEAFFRVFGASGDIALYSIVGTAFVLYGFLKFRASK